MVSRTLLVLWVLIAKGCAFALEQPQSSILHAHPRFQEFVKKHNIFKVYFRMEWFRGKTAKPMVMYTNVEWLRHLAMFRGRYSAEERLSCLVPDATTGVLRPTGSANLKDSQAYTKEFGRAVVALFVEYREKLRASMDVEVVAIASACPTAVEILSRPRGADDSWADADLERIFQKAQMDALKVCPDLIVEDLDVMP